ncbi:MAG: FtsX-like permease family protein [Anaerolineae bacterium]
MERFPMTITAMRTIRKKTLRELWRNRSRTLMVVLSVAVGVLAVGMIVATWDILITDLYRRYAAIIPAHIQISVPTGVSNDDLKGLETVPGVAQVQGRAVFNGRCRLGSTYSAATGNSPWQTIEFIAFPDAEAQGINIITPEAGAWPPQRGQAVVERSSLSEMGAKVGDTIIVETLGHELTLAIVGTAHQQDNVMASVRGSSVIIVSSETMVQLRGHDRLDTIYLTVDDLSQKASVAQAVRERLESAGYKVGCVTLLDPTIHPAQDVLQVLLLVMGILAVLALVLSSFLVTNTISALIAQQINQIGVMKAIGADTRTVMRAYSITILAYGLLGTLLATPMAERAGYRLADFCAHLLNVDLYPYRRSLPALAVMIAVGLIVPFLTAIKPLWQGASITVRQAISDYGLGGVSGANSLSRLMGRIQGLPRAWALALRNAVRVPSRLLLTLATLILGGAVFVAVLSTNESFDRTVSNLLSGQYGMDAFLVLQGEQRVSEVLPLLQSHPEVALAEPWYFSQATMGLPSGQEVQVMVQGNPDGSRFYQPRLQAGRWLQPGDSNAIVVNRKWAEEEGLRLGDVVTLDLGADYPITEWVVVGINQDLVKQQTSVFVSLDSLDRALKRSDRSLTLRLRYTSHDLAAQSRITTELVALLENNDVGVFSTETMGQVESQVSSLYHVLVVFLLVMSVLIALVGGLGLMGMMSINVLERRKEIGVMRAIGADSGAILQVFWGETMVVALLSFILAAVLSLPLSWWMARRVGLAFINTPLDFTYAAEAIGYWLAIVLVIGTLASIAPALNAANLSVRESLSYQ